MVRFAFVSMQIDCNRDHGAAVCSVQQGGLCGNSIWEQGESEVNALRQPKYCLKWQGTVSLAFTDLLMTVFADYFDE
jgi:hypothetical protein